MQAVQVDFLQDTFSELKNDNILLQLELEDLEEKKTQQELRIQQLQEQIKEANKKADKEIEEEKVISNNPKRLVIQETPNNFEQLNSQNVE